MRKHPPPDNVRRVRAISKNLRGVVISKTDRIVQFESFAERLLILCLDRDRTVRDYVSQPETFHFQDSQGKSRRYTPDFMVWRNNGHIEIHEVTRSKRRDKPSIQQREDAAHVICQQRAWTYIVHTEDTLPNTIQTANLLTLVAYRPSVYGNPAITKQVQIFLLTNRITTWQVLTEHLTALSIACVNEIEQALLHLLWHDNIATDLSQSIWSDGAIISHIKISWVGVSTCQI
ncbi:MAG: hypothetical protein Crog4KO_34810 [Crocinitomicaceae bacterium]